MMSRGTKAGLLYYAVVMLVLAASAGLSVLFSDDLITRFDRELRYRQAMDSVFQDLLDAETGQRGFLLTGRDDYLAPFINAKDNLDRHFDALLASVDTPRERDWVTQLRVLKDLKLNEMETTLRLRREDDGLNKAVAVVLNNSGKRYMDEVRTLRARSAENERSFFGRMSRLRSTLLYITALSNALCVALALLVLGQAVSQRLFRRTPKTS